MNNPTRRAIRQLLDAGRRRTTLSTSQAIVTLVLAGIAAVAIISSVAMTRWAQASPTELPERDHAASLTLHKYALPDDVAPGGPSDGSLADTVPGGAEPLAGITFEARRVYSQAEVDALVSTSSQAREDFQDAGSIAAAARGYLWLAKDAVLTGATGEDGSVTFDLTGRLGTYLVSERPDARVERAADPFLVTVPMVDPDNATAWLYDVHAYPKNYRVDVDKKILDGDRELTDVSAAQGEPVTFKVSCDIPADVASDTAFTMTDALDPRLTVAQDVPDLVVSVGDARLTRGTDYTVVVQGESVDGGASRQVLTVDLTPGVKRLAQFLGSARAGDARVSVTFAARPNELATSGSVPNGATFAITNAVGSHHAFETPLVHVHLTRIDVTKVDGSDGRTPLSGAHFRVATSLEAAQAGTWLHRVTRDGVDAGPLEVVTDTDGHATVPGLSYDLAGTTEYYLVETAAPDGFEPNANPIRVRVDAEDVTSTTSDATPTASVVVPNFAMPELPATGGVRSHALLVSGIAVVLAALGGGACAVARGARRHAR